MQGGNAALWAGRGRKGVKPEQRVAWGGDGEQEGDGFSSSLPNSWSKWNLVKVASALAAETAAPNGNDELCAL